MIKWKRTGKEVTSEGTTIRYESDQTSLIIESRKRHIPHATGTRQQGRRPSFWPDSST